MYCFIQIAKVYISVFGDKRGKEVALAGLKAKAKYIRSQLGKRMSLRLTPQLRFIEDDSIDRGCRVCYMTVVLWLYFSGALYSYRHEQKASFLDQINSIKIITRCDPTNTINV